MIYPPSRHPPVDPSVHTSNMNITRDQRVDSNQILSEASLWWGKCCIRFWRRSDRNSGFKTHIRLKNLSFLFLFVITAAGVVPCGGRKKSPHTHL